MVTSRISYTIANVLKTYGKISNIYKVNNSIVNSSVLITHLLQ